MESVRHVLFVGLLVVHLLGVVALLAGLLRQLPAPAKRVDALVRDGAGTAVVTGLALVAVASAGDDSVHWARTAAKLVIGLIILTLALANQRRDPVPTGVWAILLALSVLDVVVALAL